MSKRTSGITALVLALSTTACTSWTPAAVGPRQLIEESRPRVVRVTTADGSTRTLSAPRIAGNSIVVQGECRRVGGRNSRYLCPDERVAALDEVERIDVRRASVSRTALTTLAILTGIAYAAAPACGGQVGLCR